MNLKRLFSTPSYTIDQFDNLAWVNVYDQSENLEPLIKPLQKNGIIGAIHINRFKSSIPSKAKIWFGEVPEEKIIEEHGVRYELRLFQNHPGLFLDHQRTRLWLLKNTHNKTVLNLFSYTGSLGIASAVGGALSTHNIDLSKPITSWANKNAQLNQLGSNHQIINGDVFDWLERFAKKQITFDIIISDPPSQSRSTIMHFSTAKHLDMLHHKMLRILSPKGVLISSINTETLSEEILQKSIQNQATALGLGRITTQSLPLPVGFQDDFRSMKGVRAFF